MDNSKRTVVVTGFGPFGEHTVNASWVAVQIAFEYKHATSLGKHGSYATSCCRQGPQQDSLFQRETTVMCYIDENNNFTSQNTGVAGLQLPRLELKKLGLGSEVDLHVSEVPVEYQTVQSLVPSLWKQYRPMLVVHVGVSGMATTVTLEKCGRNHGYKGLDNSSFCPDSQCCIVGGPDCIDSVLDMESVCKRVTASGLGVAVSVSKDAGRYLCDFTYYTSLYLSHGRSAFVHVPPLGKPYTGEDLGRALQAIVREMLELLDQAEEKIHCQQHFH